MPKNTSAESLKERKRIFLESLHSPTKKYKRYSKSPLRYGGGKSLAVGTIIEYLPDDIERVVSPFFGGGSVEIAIARELGIEVIGYDIFDLLVNYWQYQIREPERLYEALRALPPTKAEYERIKWELKKTWNQHTGTNDYMDSWIKAVYYYYNHNLSYGPGFLGWMSSNYLSEKKYHSMLEKVRDCTLDNLHISCARYEDVLPLHRDDFLYLDPPYYLEGDSKMFRGIYPMRNFPIHHNWFDHQQLADMLHEHRGGYILSYNDCSWVREAYQDCQIIEVSWQYTMWQWETRIGKNRLSRDYDNGNTKSSHELLIIW